EGSIIRQYEQSFAAYDIEVLFRDDGLRRIAELAGEEKTGARGLMTVCERAFRDLKFELPSTDVRRFVVDQALVDTPRVELEKLLAAHAQEAHGVMRQLVDEFAVRFEKDHGLKIGFTEAAAEQLIHLASQRSVPLRQLCAERFKDYQFGLKLISKNTGVLEFTLDLPAVEDPDKTLSEWVVASYRDRKAETGPEQV
ncbi:MAG TPA: ATP-dependent protease, partial [Verrucomicrobiae bacterium]|nr:ATP-dependent protease [Verrucomicrobiae bacterium]